MVPELSERDQLYQDLDQYLVRLRTYSERPENRARRLSLAITNIEQGQMWLREHIVNDPLPEANHAG